MRVVSLRMEDGTHTVIMGDAGRKYTPFVMLDYPVKLKKIGNRDAEKFSRDTGYPLKKAVRKFLSFGNKKLDGKRNITKGAKRFLKEAVA